MNDARQLKPIQSFHVSNHGADAQKESINLEDGTWWEWDMHQYVGDTKDGVRPYVGQVYRVEGMMVQIFKVTRVWGYSFVQVDWDWYLRGDKP